MIAVSIRGAFASSSSFLHSVLPVVAFLGANQSPAPPPASSLCRRGALHQRKHTRDFNWIRSLGRGRADTGLAKRAPGKARTRRRKCREKGKGQFRGGHGCRSEKRHRSEHHPCTPLDGLRGEKDLGVAVGRKASRRSLPGFPSSPFLPSRHFSSPRTECGFLASCQTET